MSKPSNFRKRFHAILCRIGIHDFLIVPDSEAVRLGPSHMLLVCRRCMRKAMVAEVRHE